MRKGEGVFVLGVGRLQAKGYLWIEETDAAHRKMAGYKGTMGKPF